MSKYELSGKPKFSQWLVAIVIFVLIVLSGVLYLFFCPDDKFDLRTYICYVVSLLWTLLFYYIPKNKVVDTVLGTIVTAVSPIYILYLILNNNALKSSSEIIFNALVIFLGICILFLFTQSTKWAVGSVAAFCWFFYNINEVIVCFRKTPIVPSDIFSFSTAMAVSGQYTLTLNESMIRSTVAFVIILILVIKFDIKIRPFSFKLCWMPVIPIIIAGYFMNNVSEAAFKTVDNFDTAASNNRAGILNTFIVNAKNMIVDKPENYSKKKAVETLKKYDDNDTFSNEDMPNVIVIMNEAFSDLRIVGDFETNIPFMEYIDNMEENTIKGNMLVSVLGGNTCNTEYEFLTGNSLNFLPKGYIPFIRTITEETDSLCYEFSELGYENIAIHPYMPECWRRNIVYPFLGFDRFVSGYDFDDSFDVEEFKLRGRVDFGDLDYVRKYVSDKESYNRVIEEFENKGDSKAFIFNVTMQNHGPYTYTGKDFTPDVKAEKLKLSESEKSELDQYLSLIKKSDEAFGELVEYFKAVDEDTVIVMFGDHMPGLASNTFKSIYENNTNGQALSQLKYTVPFVIWANYDIDEKDVEITSSNYLSLYLKDVLGMNKTNWDNLRAAMSQEYPAINYFGAYNKDKKWIDREALEAESLEEYENVQYGKMFGNIE